MQMIILSLSIHKNVDNVIQTLLTKSDVLIDWFKCNKMQANPDKFQAIVVGKKSFLKNPNL